jgi:hypothetical protein|uniref:Transmembrane protein n=1 Tax=viral metagenome TaxID=1070528 RepID=A0A6C0CL56_9ZZZZ
MDRLEKNTANNNDEGFIKTVFPFDDAQKATLLNILQYSILAIIPIIMVLKLIKNYVPEVDDDKGSLVILVEVIGQIFVMFLALYFIHRIINYIPTYSGVVYGDVNLITVILPTIFIILTMQTKVGEKVQLLIDRLMDVYDGQTNTKKEDKNQKQVNVRVTQPISGQQHNAQINVSQPPPAAQMTNMKSQSNEYSIPQSPNFNNMYGGPETPLVGAATPGMDMMQEPMAANDMLGGSFGSSF